MKFTKNDTSSLSIFATHLDTLIPKNHPKRVILDKLDWGVLANIGQEAYKSDDYSFAENPRVMMGLFVYSCIVDKKYREMEEDIMFNSLCQYACGFAEVKLRTIDHTTILKFEQKLGMENILKVKDMIEKASIKNQPPRSRGTHSWDTSVVESNVTYPTDTKLLESVRKFLTENVIIKHSKTVKQVHRHYGRVARKEYVDFCKKRKPKKAVIRKCLKSQLQYVKRNINQAEEVITELEKIADTKKEKKQAKKLKQRLQTAKKIHEQQTSLYHGQKIKNRIVSFHRPEVRPIYRGKTKQATEFGVKVGMTVCGKAIVLTEMSYENFFDGHGLNRAVGRIRNRGHPINEMIGDKGNEGCHRFLKAEKIKDGVERKKPKKGAEPHTKVLTKKKFIRERNKMEGAFGTIKNVFHLQKQRAKTSFGDLLKICKACIGFNLRYAF